MFHSIYCSRTPGDISDDERPGCVIHFQSMIKIFYIPQCQIEKCRSRSRSPVPSSSALEMTEPACFQWATLGLSQLGLPPGLLKDPLEEPIVT